MKRKIWVVSDTHYNHTKILEFTGSDGKLIRPGFDNVDQMNECIIDCWNSRVSPGDIVYHLGDVFFGSKEKFENDWKKFNGKKRLILGNHDDAVYMVKQKHFEKVLMWRMFPEYGVMLSHVPLHPASLMRGAPDSGKKPLINCHGHIHQNPSPEGPYYNCSLEAINYSPVNIEEIWLTDGFGSVWYNHCLECGYNGGLEIVRPGKVQCNNCPTT